MNIQDKNEIMALLQKTSRRFFAGGVDSRMQGSRARLGQTQWMLIQTIIDNPGISQEEVASKMDLDKTTIAKAVKKLEMHEMLRREKSQEDARKYQLFASDEAVNMKDTMNKRRNDRNTLALEGIDDAELETFKGTLEKIEGNMKSNYMNMRKHKVEVVIGIIDSLMDNPGQSKEELLANAKDEREHLTFMLNYLAQRDIVEIKDGLYYTTRKAALAKEKIKYHDHLTGRHGRRGHHRDFMKL